MIERKRGCPAIVATRNDHALPSRFLLAGLRPARMVHGTSGSALTFARCTRSLIHMKRLRVFQTFVHSVFSRALRACSHGMRDQSPALFTKTSHGIDDRPHSRSAGLLTDRFALRLLTGLRPVRMVRGTSGPALFTFEAPLRLRAALPRDGLRDQRSRTQPRLADSARHRTPAGRSGVTR